MFRCWIRNLLPFSSRHQQFCCPFVRNPVSNTEHREKQEASAEWQTSVVALFCNRLLISEELQLRWQIMMFPQMFLWTMPVICSSVPSRWDSRQSIQRFRNSFCGWSVCCPSPDDSTSLRLLVQEFGVAHRMQQKQTQRRILERCRTSEHCSGHDILCMTSLIKSKQVAVTWMEAHGEMHRMGRWRKQ